MKVSNAQQVQNSYVDIHIYYTGRLIMYSGVTKNYYKKTVGHVFTKPVQIEGTTENFFSQ
jgi:hypothetical protein